MDEFLQVVRLAFRKMHGLSGPVSGPVPVPLYASLSARARRHRITGLLQAGLADPPPELRPAAYGQSRHSAGCTLEAERLCSRLTPSIPALTLIKGPVLAAQAWPDPGLRSFDDLDFLCNRSDFHRLVEGMRAAGYEARLSDPRRLAHLWHYGWGITFLNPAGNFMVEANHRFFRPHFPGPRTLDVRHGELFIRQPLDHDDVRAPAPGTHLLYSSLHAVWHGWARLAWLADIAGLLVRHPEALPQARRLAAPQPFARCALEAALGVADRLFGPGLCPAAAPPPAVIQQAMDLFAGSARSLQGPELRAFHQLFMTPREQQVYRLQRIATPGDGDFQWISLPPSLRALYRPLRLLRGFLHGRT